MFLAVLLNLVLILTLTAISGLNFYICFASLFCMFMLPFGRKGNFYHIAVSTAGLIFYLIVFMNVFINLT